MGRVKQMVMDQEEQFYDIAQEIIGECGTYLEYENHLERKHKKLVPHLCWDEMRDEILDYWYEYQYKFVEGGR